jgi:hypothetical protein
LAGEYYLRLRVVGGTDVAIGHVFGADAIPDLLRDLANYYDEDPDACAGLLEPQCRAAVPRHVAYPFSVR